MDADMEHREPDPESPAAPEAGELEPYFAGSPVAESFAPGMLDESALALPALHEETPWRRRPGPRPELEPSPRPRRRVRPEPAQPEPALAGVTAGAPPHAPVRAGKASAHPGTALDPDEIPDCAMPHAPHGEVDEAPAAAPTTGPLRVLVVHPNLGTRRQVQAVLGEMGLDAATCGDAEQAVLQVLHERPDAVVAEIGHSDLDALELCRKLHDRAPAIPVLLVAPGDDEGNYSLAMESGAADYLRRPLTPQHLAERLRDVARKAHAAHPMAPIVPQIDADSGDAHSLSRQLRRQELKIQSLFELSKNVFGCLELDELYHGFLLTAMGQLGLSAGVLYHLNGSAGGRLLDVVSRGLPAAEVRNLLDFRAGLGAYLLRSPQPVLLDAAYTPQEYHAEVETLRRAGLAVACPMASKGMPVGVALFGPRVSGDALGPDDLLLLSAVCNFAGPALDSARLYTELHLTYLSTVRAFVSSLEAKDTYTRGHSERVADYARGLAQAFGFKRRDLDMIVFGAMLHDIGKIGVSEGILNKPGPLTPDEWRVVRSHPEMGARIVSHIEYLSPAVGLILHHHERVDGRGYPHGLTGDDIELGTRMVTVADSFDAMTTHRPYRQAMEVSQAVRLLRVHTGRQFDPQVVDTFVGLLEAGTLHVKS
jgi:response regulator RpfG family c-di-GMP phosphodiesterase